MHGSESFGLNVRREQDSAIGAVCEGLVLGGKTGLMRVLAGQDPEVGRPAAQEIERLLALGAAILQADDVLVFGKLEQRVVTDIDRGTVGNVVKHDRPGSMVSKNAEMTRETA